MINEPWLNFRLYDYYEPSIIKHTRVYEVFGPYIFPSKHNRCLFNYLFELKLSVFRLQPFLWLFCEELFVYLMLGNVIRKICLEWYHRVLCLLGCPKCQNLWKWPLPEWFRLGFALKLPTMPKKFKKNISRGLCRALVGLLHSAST